MDSQTAWSKTSLVNIKSDNYDNLSSASISGSNIVINNEGYAEYTYNYDPPPEDPEEGQEPKEDTSIKTNKLQFDLRVNSNNNQDVTRYNEKLIIEVTIQYYIETYNSSGEHTGWKEGNIDIINIYPYLQIETDGYTRTYIIDISDTPIKTLNIKYKSKFNSIITFYNPRLFYSMTVVKAVEEYGGSGGGGGGGGGDEMPPYVPPSETVYNTVKYIRSTGTMKSSNITFETPKLVDGIVYGETWDIGYKGSVIGKVTYYVQNEQTVSLRWTIETSSGLWTYKFFYNSPVFVDSLQVRKASKQSWVNVPIWLNVGGINGLNKQFSIDGISQPDKEVTTDLMFRYDIICDHGELNGEFVNIRNTYNNINIVAKNSLWREGKNTIYIYDANDVPVFYFEALATLS